MHSQVDKIYIDSSASQNSFATAKRNHQVNKQTTCSFDILIGCQGVGEIQGYSRSLFSVFRNCQMISTTTKMPWTDCGQRPHD